MRRLKRYPIGSRADLIYAKIDISQYLFASEERELFAFAVMELGSNILKHAGGEGELWLLSWRDRIAIAACDRGGGIANVEQARQRGYSRLGPASLGIGLSALSQSHAHRLSIYSHTQPPLHGTVAWFGPLLAPRPIEWMSRPLIDNANGDFFCQQGQHFIFGDAAGHGQIAQRTAERLMTYFTQHCHAPTNANECLSNLHALIPNERLRSADVVIGQWNEKHITLTGVGNLQGMVIASHGLKTLTFSRGSIGYYHQPPEPIILPCDDTPAVLIASDGIDKRTLAAMDLRQALTEPLAFLTAAVFFAARPSDDASVMLFIPPQAQRERGRSGDGSSSEPVSSSPDLHTESG